MNGKKGAIDIEIDEELFKKLERVAAAEDSAEAVMKAGGITVRDLRKALPDLPAEERAVVEDFLGVRSATTGRRASRSKRPSAGSEAMIISKARVKAAVRKCNVGAEFYDALESEVRDLIKRAEDRAVRNKRKTLRAEDV